MLGMSWLVGSKWMASLAFVCSLCATALLPSAYAALETATQDDAVQAIRRAGGNVFYDEEQWVVRVSLARAEVTDELLDVLGSLDSIEALDLGGANITPLGLTCLEKLTRLRELDLSGVFLPEGATEHISKLHALETLDLTATRVMDDALSPLGNLTNLRCLVLAGNRLDGSGLVHLTGMSQLETLDLSYNQLESRHLSHLGRLENLVRLSLDGNELPEATGFDALGDLARLKELRLAIGFPENYFRIHENPTDDIGRFEFLAKLGQLESLYLASPLPGGFLRSESFDSMRRSLLRVATLSTPVSPRDFRAMLQLKNLREFETAYSSTIPDPGHFPPTEWTKLRALTIPGPLQEKAYQNLGALARLETLELSGATIGGDELNHAVSVPELSRLSLTARDGKVFEQLGKMTALKRLRVGFEWPNPEELGGFVPSPEKVAGAFSSLENLESLSLHRVPRHVAEVLPSALRKLPRLRALRLSHTHLDRDALYELRWLTQLEDLQLWYCTIPKAMTRNEALEFLTHWYGLKKLTWHQFGHRDQDSDDPCPIAKLQSLEVLRGWTPKKPRKYVARKSLRYLEVTSRRSFDDRTEQERNAELRDAFPNARFYIKPNPFIKQLVRKVPPQSRLDLLLDHMVLVQTRGGAVACQR